MSIPFHSGASGTTRALAMSLSMALVLSAPMAWADSTSSASSAASGSVGSSSASLETSSNSSSSKQRVAQGPYTVVAMVAVDQQPDLVQLQLQAQTMPATGPQTSPDTAQAANAAQVTVVTFTLRLPRQTAQQAQLAVGTTVLAQHRPYGLALATPTEQGQSRPFFLVMDGDGERELALRAVGG
jgi:hypothetical protein